MGHYNKLWVNRAYTIGMGQAAQSGKFAQVGIINQSQTAQVAVVRGWTVNTQSTAFVYFYRAVTAVPGSGTQQPIPIHQPKGTGCVIGFTAAPSSGAPAVVDWAVDPAQGQQPSWPWNFPVCVLEPGWAFIAIASGADTQLNASFFWEEMLPDELEDWLESLEEHGA